MRALTNFFLATGMQSEAGGILRLAGRQLGNPTAGIHPRPTVFCEMEDRFCLPWIEYAVRFCPIEFHVKPKEV